MDCTHDVTLCSPWCDTHRGTFDAGGAEAVLFGVEGSKVDKYRKLNFPSEGSMDTIYRFYAKLKTGTKGPGTFKTDKKLDAMAKIWLSVEERMLPPSNRGLKDRDVAMQLVIMRRCVDALIKRAHAKLAFTRTEVQKYVAEVQIVTQNLRERATGAARQSAPMSSTPDATGRRHLHRPDGPKRRPRQTRLDRRMGCALSILLGIICAGII